MFNFEIKSFAPPYAIVDNYGTNPAAVSTPVFINDDPIVDGFATADYIISGAF